MGPCFRRDDEQSLRRLVQKRLALAQETAEPPPLALAWNEVDVADELGAALAAFQHDLAAVERFELHAMRDADDGRFRQLAGDDVHHLVLAHFIERTQRKSEGSLVVPAYAVRCKGCERAT